MSDVKRVSVDAPAKINLFLHVTGRRDDGYHLLESFVAFTGMGDRITVEPAAGLTLSISGPFSDGLSETATDNLVLRAAEALRSESAISAGAHITLEKNLPVSSGIGGGSADAAATLRVLTVLWETDIAPSRLAEIGLGLGADVPVCLNARPAMMSGVGETVVDAAPPPSCGVVLVNAREGVSTPAVFAARNPPFSPPTGWETPGTFEAFAAALNDRSNDLSAAAAEVSPVIGEVLGSLADQPGCALPRLSGSGGTCFGLFPCSAAAEEAAARILAAHPGWWCVATTFRTEPAKITMG